MEAPVILQEGLATRSKSGVKGWICTSCNHVMSFLAHNGGCPNCKSANIQPIKSQERLHEETEAMKDTQRFHYWQPESFNPQSAESQTGKWLTTDQVLSIIQRWIPGAKYFPQFNPIIGRMLAAFYIPHFWKPEQLSYISAIEKNSNLMFVCCGELGAMREWDLLPQDSDGMPLPFERGWRGVLGKFYRAGMIPFVPDDGQRLGWWQIRESVNKEKIGG